MDLDYVYVRCYMCTLCICICTYVHARLQSDTPVVKMYSSQAQKRFSTLYMNYSRVPKRNLDSTRPSLKIKEWKTLWLPDSVIGRPPALPKKNRNSKKNSEKEDEGVDDDEVGERNKFSPLKAFNNVGTRKIRVAVREEAVDIDQKIVLDNFTVERIVKICFNGLN